MRNVWTILKKEWDRVMKDKRLIISVILLPGLMIFLIYTFIGSAIDNISSGDQYQVVVINPTSDFASYYTNQTTYQITVTVGDEASLSTYESEIDNENLDLLVYLSSDILLYDGSNTKGSITLYYNPNSQTSSTIFTVFADYINDYQTQLNYELWGDQTSFTISIGNTPVNQDVISGMMLSMLLPMLIVMFLFAGVMAIGPESISGEKERNTISTLLITPVKRSEIALGKVLGLSVLSLLSACSSFLGIILSLPKLFQMETSFSLDIYSLGQYLMILFVIFSTVLVVVGLVSIISAYAKSVKEAGTLITPLYIFTILIGVTSMFSSTANTNYFMYLIPLYNSVQTLTSIFSFETNAWIYMLITISSNVVYVVGLIYLLNKMFNSEKIMFSK